MNAQLKKLLKNNMKYLILLLLPLNLYAKTIRIAVIDSGFNQEYKSETVLCKDGHYDFVSETKTIGADELNHGTIIARLIAKQITIDNYCIVIYKVFHLTPTGPRVEPGILGRALDLAAKSNIDIINFSISGRGFNQAEYEGLLKLKGKRITVAAGNNGLNLDNRCDIYPACYKGIENKIVVGALDSNNERLTRSNYGSIVSSWELGEFVVDEQVVKGTSFATAIETAKIANDLPQQYIKPKGLIQSTKQKLLKAIKHLEKLVND